MGFLKDPLTTCMDALFLREELFRAIREITLRQALTLILCVGFIAGGAGFIGQIIRNANEPTFQEVEGIWKEPMRQQQKNAPWFSKLPEEARQEWDGWYDMGWKSVGAIFSFISPSPVGAFMGLFAGVMGKLLIWIVVGLILFVCARILGGAGTLDSTLVAVSLGVAPHLLEVANVLPYVMTGGIFVWSCVIIAKGIMNVHGLTKGKAFLSLILPALAVLVIFFFFGVIA